MLAAMVLCEHGGEREVCVHVASDEAAPFVLAFTGRGTEHRLLCEGCADAEAPPRVLVCNACFDARSACHFDHAGVRGAPEVRVRRSALRVVERPVAVPGRDGPPVAVTAGPGSSWVCLDGDGRLAVTDPEARALRPVADLGDSAVDRGARVNLEVSPDGGFVTVVEARGRHGVVVDLGNGRITMQLDRGGHHGKHSEHSIAFVRDGAHVRLIHATTSNRLDVSDPATGALLTARDPNLAPSADSRRATHALDYFHAGLTVSPDGRWLIDDGWVWHPVGVLRRVDVHRWLHDNLWESEDGPSVAALRTCAYVWDVARAFVDARTLAVWGFGGDDDWMVDAALIYDVETARRVRWFAGPPRGRFVVDQHLIALGADGTSVWDLATGERLLDAPGFTPVAHHPGTHRFLSVAADGALVESRLVDG